MRHSACKNTRGAGGTDHRICSKNSYGAELVHSNKCNIISNSNKVQMTLQHIICVSAENDNYRVFLMS